MVTINQILLVDKDMTANLEADHKIKQASIAKSVKVTMNGGHAMLYLEQINEKLLNSPLVILLNIDTPIMNGYEFLHSFNNCKSISKDKILVIVLKDNLSEDKINLLKEKGIQHFIQNDFDPKELSSMISQHYQNSSAFEPQTAHNQSSYKFKNKKGNNHFQSMNAA